MGPRGRMGPNRRTPPPSLPALPVLCVAVCAAACLAAAGAETDCKHSSDNMTEAEVAAWRAAKGFYEAAGGDGWRDRTCWSVAGEEPVRVCDTSGFIPSSTWFGVDGCTEEGRVNALSLTQNALQGDLADVAEALRAMPSLDTIMLGLNFLSGEAHGNWSDATGRRRLRQVALAGNRLSGSLPGVYSGVAEYGSVKWSNNAGITGTVPAHWVVPPSFSVEADGCSLFGDMPAHFTGNSSSLADLQISRNSIGGTFHSAWSGLGQLSLLDLSNTELHGPFPSSVSGLGSLRQLSLAGTRVGAGQQLPSNVTGLESLSSLSLDGCLFEGPVHSDWSGYGRLESLSLAHMPLLSGSLPATWTGLDQVFVLDLSGLAFSPPAPFPAAWAGLGELSELILDGSSGFAGGLPASVAGLENLSTLRAADLGGLSGTFPTEWDGWKSLNELLIGSNRGLGGVLPASVRGLESVTSLDLSRCSFEGELPGGWEGFGALASVLLNENSLSGTLRKSFSGSAMQSLNLAGNAISGDLDGPFTGLARLYALDVSRTRVGGTLGRNALLGLDHLSEFRAQGTLVSGTIPDDLLARNPNFNGNSGAILNLSHCRLSGTLPALASFGEGMAAVDLSNNAISGTLAVAARRWLTGTRELALSNTRLSGALAPYMFARALELRLGGNSFDSFGDSLRGGVSPGMTGIYLDRNRIREVPAAICSQAGHALFTVTLFENLLSAVPACLGSLPNLALLDLGRNLLERLPPGFAMGEASPRSLLLGANRLTGAGLFTPPSDGSRSRVAEVDLSGNPINWEVSHALYKVSRAFPRVQRVSLRASGLYGTLTELDGLSRGTSLDLSDNPSFFGFYSAGVPLGSLETLRVDNTGFILPPAGGTANLREYSRRGLDACPPLELLASSRATLVDLSGSLSAPLSCNNEPVLRLLEPGGSGKRFFPGPELTCPQWMTKASRAVVLADASFLNYERCRCLDGRAWRAAEGSCRTCAAVSGVLRCDPYVRSAAHCVVQPNAYPVSAATGRRPEWAGDLLDASFVRCQRPGLCNTGWRACAAREFFDAAHALPPGEDPTRVVPVPYAYSCAQGHDPESLLCSRCLPGRWASGGACVPCSEAMRWLVPAVWAALVAGAAAVLWVVSGRSVSRYRTLSVALLWFQVTALLEASSQAQAGTVETSTWRWLAAVRGTAESWAVLRPWAAQCAAGMRHVRVDFLSESDAVLLAPFALLAVAAAAALLAHGVAARRRVSYMAGWTAVALFLPTTTRALQAFSCVSAGGVRFLAAAPYVSCGGPFWGGRLGRTRALGLAALLLYSLPFLAAVAAVLRRARRRARAASDGHGARPAALSVPLMEVGGGGGGAGGGGTGAAAAEVGSGETRAEVGLAESLLLGSLRDPVGLLWWPLWYECGRAVALSLLVGLVPVTSPLLPTGVFLVLAACAVAQSRYRPAWYAVDNALESAVLVALLAVFGVNIIGGATSAATREGDAGDDSASGRGLIVTVASVIHIVMIALLVSAIALRNTELVQKMAGLSPLSGEPASPSRSSGAVSPPSALVHGMSD